MNLEQLQQETEDLKQIDITKLSPEQLHQLVEKLSNILTQSEQSLIQTSLIEINENENDESNNS